VFISIIIVFMSKIVKPVKIKKTPFVVVTEEIIDVPKMSSVQFKLIQFVNFLLILTAIFCKLICFAYFGISDNVHIHAATFFYECIYIFNHKFSILRSAYKKLKNAIKMLTIP
jgi:hypothetical protein